MVKKRTPTQTQRTAFGDMIRDRQKYYGFTQEELAVLMDCSPHWITKIECGKSNPNWLDAFRLAYILEMSVSDVLKEVDGLVSVPANQT